jgi:hypothetical protein
LFRDQRRQRIANARRQQDIRPAQQGFECH